jgi:Receptor L domain
VEVFKILANIEEIYEYLRIFKTPFIENLGIFTKLKRIRGSKLYQGNYSLVLSHNPNFSFMWVVNQTVTIDRGELLLEQNRKLTTVNEPYVIKMEVAPKSYAATVSFTLPAYINQFDEEKYSYYLYTESDFVEHFYCPAKLYDKLV